MKSLKRDASGKLVLTSTPATDDKLSQQEIEDIEASEKEFKEGKCKTFNSVEDLLEDLHKGRKSMKARRSPVVTSANKPASLLRHPPAPRKAVLAASLFTEDSLLAAMRSAGGRHLRTEQFALLVTPRVKPSEDFIGHELWDIAHQHVRELARRLAKRDLLEISRDPSSKKLRYVYNLKD